MFERNFVTTRNTETLYRVGPGALAELRQWLEPLPERVPLIADAMAWELHGPEVCKSLYPCEPLVLLVDGEEDKNLATIERLTHQLATQRVHRQEKLVCFGGGACCDISGLLALLYMRGMSYAIVATSLMAQVDAAIGGKVASNFGSRKNLVGGFHHPDLVLLDPKFPRTLPTREFRAAVAEVIKLGIILPDLDLSTVLDSLVIPNLDSAPLLVPRCLDGKLRLLEDDPFESNLDRLLNLGHGVAHALEKISDLHLLHGEAVAIGLASTARFAARQGYCTPEHGQRILRQLERFELPLGVKVDRDELWLRLSEVTDHRGGKIRLAVPVADVGAEVLDGGDLDLLVDCVDLAVSTG